jgi:hypothetical protein
MRQMKKTIGHATTMAMVMASLVMGCGMEEEQTIEELKQVSETDVIIDNLLRAGYPEAEIEVLSDGRVVVGSDAVVTLEASREMVGHTDDFDMNDDFRQYRTTNIVNTLTVNTICIAPTAEFNANAAASQALDLAISRYNALGLQFTMVRNGNGCDATIAAKLDNSGGGVSGFPSGGLPYPEFYIGATVASQYGVQVGAHVIEHELGHCIGFRHTDYYDRSISCGGAKTNEGAADVGAVHIAGTPSTAVLNGSVMNSCYNGGSTGVWTASDEVALSCLYETGSCAPPAPPSYFNLARYSNESAARRAKSYYGPFNATQYSAIRFTTTGANGDADLYVRVGAQPTTSIYDCRSVGANSNEVCEANPSADGSYYVMVYAYSAYSGLTVDVDVAN